MPFVYVMNRANGDMKIGFSHEPAKRLFQVPGALTLLAAWQHDDARQIERAAHELLQTARQDGEWFAVDRYTAFNAINRVMREIDEENTPKPRLLPAPAPLPPVPEADQERHPLGYAQALPNVPVSRQVQWMLSRVAEQDIYIELSNSTNRELDAAMKDVREGDLFFAWSREVFGRLAPAIEDRIQSKGADLVTAL